MSGLLRTPSSLPPLFIRALTNPSIAALSHSTVILTTGTIHCCTSLQCSSLQLSLPCRTGAPARGRTLEPLSESGVAIANYLLLASISGAVVSQPERVCAGGGGLLISAPPCKLPAPSGARDAKCFFRLLRRI